MATSPVKAETVGLAPEQAAVDGALAASSVPAAAVVLELGSAPRLLALGGRDGADPATLLARPGSTVKPLVGWLAAEAGVYQAGESVTCQGIYRPEQPFHCFGSHGPLDLTRAIEVSCNVYFMALGERLGLGRLSAGLGRLGLTVPTGLVARERSGWVATPEWAAARASDATQWELPVGMGHGPFEVTLLELAVAYAKLAALLQEPSPRVSDAIRAEISAGLRGVVEDADGTGHRARTPGLDIAGKTGTAESEPFGSKASDGAKENGWFVGYAPASAPKRLVAVLVLRSGSGGETAAPLAGRIFAAVGDGSGSPQP
jgi:penicillin-binding protein 2